MHGPMRAERRQKEVQNLLFLTPQLRNCRILQTVGPAFTAGASARRLNLHPPLVFSFSGLSEGVPYEPTHTTPANSRIFRMLNFINKATYWSVHGAPARCATTRISPRFRQGGRESAGGDSRKSAIFFRASVCVCEVEFTHQTVVLTYLEHSM